MTKNILAILDYIGMWLMFAVFAFTLHLGGIEVMSFGYWLCLIVGGAMYLQGYMEGHKDGSVYGYTLGQSQELTK